MMGDSCSKSKSTKSKIFVEPQYDDFIQGMKKYGIDLQPTYVGRFPGDNKEERKHFEEIHTEDFNRAKEEVMNILEAVHHVAISMELWEWGKENHTMYTATAHFIHQSKYVSQTLFTLEIGEEDGIENIGSEIENELIDWNIMEKVVCFVTTGGDNGSLLRQTARNYFKIPHTYCVVESMKLIIQNGLRKLDYEELQMQCQNDNPQVTFDTYDPFDWYNKYNLLKYISENNAGDFTDNDRKILCETYQVLRPFEDFNNKLSAQPYLPVSNLISFNDDFKLKISGNTPTTDYAKLLQKNYEGIYFRYDVSGGLSLKATFMDPRFKTLALSQEGAKDILQALTEELDERMKNNQGDVPTTSNESEGTEKELNNMADDGDVAKSYSDAKAIVSNYINAPDLRLDENPFKFWDDFNNSSKCNEFYKMSQKYLCIPMNAMPVHKVSGEFPWMKDPKDNFYELRGTLEFNNIDKVLFMYSYNSRTEK